MWDNVLGSVSAIKLQFDNTCNNTNNDALIYLLKVGDSKAANCPLDDVQDLREHLNSWAAGRYAPGSLL